MSLLAFVGETCRLHLRVWSIYVTNRFVYYYRHSTEHLALNRDWNWKQRIFPKHLSAIKIWNLVSTSNLGSVINSTETYKRIPCFRLKTPPSFWCLRTRLDVSNADLKIGIACKHSCKHSSGYFFSVGIAYSWILWSVSQNSLRFLMGSTAAMFSKFRDFLLKLMLGKCVTCRQSQCSSD
jgi:hypothetical protein